MSFTALIYPWTMANSPCLSGPPAVGNPHFCGLSQVWRMPPAGRWKSAEPMSPTSNRLTVVSPWCSSPMRSIREPLSNLDAELRVQMRLEIAKLHKELGATMIYVTHDQVEAMTLADKIVVLRAGRVEQVGSPLHLYDDPDNSFVAGFIGSPRMNFLPAVVEASDGETLTVRLTDMGDVVVPMTITSPHPQKGAELSLGIRPEHFDPAGAIRIETPVDVIENLGGSSFAYSRSEEELPLTIELRGNREAREGDLLKTGFDPARAFLFDARSGLRLR